MMKPWVGPITRLIRICSIIGSVAVVLAQTSGPAALTPNSFTATGLNNEKLLKSLFLGDFVNIGFNSDDLRFATMYGQYLNAYGRRCNAYLPPNKVEITTQECATESVTRNGFGTEISRSCVSYRTVGTGLYADPEMYAAKKKLDQVQAGDALRNAAKLMGQKDPIAGMMNMVGNAQASMSDMESLVQLNACASPGLKRFQENLRLFALNKQPIRLGAEGPKSSAVDPLPGTPFRDQNYTKLLNDLIAEQATTWVVNRFVRGSVARATVSSRDDVGRPRRITASYTYNGRSQGSVTLSFTDGLPECMYFFDFPATCRTPNRKIVAAYADGAYQ